MRVQLKRSLYPLAALLLFSICACSSSVYSDEIDTFDKTYVDPDSLTMAYGDFHTPLQSGYIHSGFSTISSFADGTKELSKPQPINLEFPAGESATYLQISTDSAFTNAETITTLGKKSYDFYNPYLSTTYYWRIAKNKESFTDAKVYTFETTSDAPRNINLAGVTNVRDLGGYSSKLGGTVRQGLYYRGGALTGGSDTPSLKITANGLTTLTKTMGVKTEIDLRMTEEANGNPENGHMNDSVIPEVSYHSLPINWDTKDMITDCKDTMCQVFRIYANKDNYPVYVHCSIGTDRTGCVSYVMGALLGIKNEDLYHDYLFSNFGNIGSSRNSITVRETYQNDLKAYNKPTLAECAESYLIDCGLTQNEVNSIRDIMIEK